VGTLKLIRKHRGSDFYLMDFIPAALLFVFSAAAIYGSHRDALGGFIAGVLFLLGCTSARTTWRKLATEASEEQEHEERRIAEGWASHGSSQPSTFGTLAWAGFWLAVVAAAMAFLVFGLPALGSHNDCGGPGQYECPPPCYSNGTC
jgi:hypothetical protein